MPDHILLQYFAGDNCKILEWCEFVWAWAKNSSTPQLFSTSLFRLFSPAHKTGKSRSLKNQGVEDQKKFQGNSIQDKISHITLANVAAETTETVAAAQKKESRANVSKLLVATSQRHPKQRITKSSIRPETSSSLFSMICSYVLFMTSWQQSSNKKKGEFHQGTRQENHSCQESPHSQWNSHLRKTTSYQQGKRHQNHQQIWVTLISLAGDNGDIRCFSIFCCSNESSILEGSHWHPQPPPSTTLHYPPLFCVFLLLTVFGRVA